MNYDGEGKVVLNTLDVKALKRAAGIAQFCAAEDPFTPDAELVTTAQRLRTLAGKHEAADEAAPPAAKGKP